MAEDLFWKVLEHLRTIQPLFGGRRFKGMPRRFKKVVHLVDSTTIALVANCMDWAKHRRRKAAAKLHMRLDLQSMLPRFAIVDTARDSDNGRARELCAAVRSGEIVIFDRAYVDFAHLFGMSSRGIFWVTRTKDNLKLRVVKRRLKKPSGAILRDDEVVLLIPSSRGKYPMRMRRIIALVELDGKETELEFLANNLDWAASSIADLYRCRWQIEAFFKQIKQTLQLCDFLGHSANAVRWQVWIALLLYVLLRFQAFLHQWNHSFIRLFTLVRGRYLGSLSPARSPGLLWDSIWPMANVRAPRAGLFSRVRARSCGTARGMKTRHPPPGGAQNSCQRLSPIRGCNLSFSTTYRSQICAVGWL